MTVSRGSGVLFPRQEIRAGAPSSRVRFSGQALRAELLAEPIDGPAEIEVDFVQGDWIVRRRFRVHTGRRGQEPRLEPVSQRRL
jgi:hypothetical protein